jgi:hypothetical protein
LDVPEVEIQLSRAGDQVGELVRLVPFLADALVADARGLGDGMPGSPNRNPHRALVNTEVEHAVHVVRLEVRAVDAAGRAMVNEQPHRGPDPLDILRPMAGLIRRVANAGHVTVALGLGERVAYVLHVVRSALAMDAGDIALACCPLCDGGTLVIPGQRAEAHVQRVNGQTTVDRGADEAITWERAIGIECRGCGAYWHPSQARALAEYLVAA